MGNGLWKVPDRAVIGHSATGARTHKGLCTPPPLPPPLFGYVRGQSVTILHLLAGSAEGLSVGRHAEGHWPRRLSADSELWLVCSVACHMTIKGRESGYIQQKLVSSEFALAVMFVAGSADQNHNGSGSVLGSVI